MSDFETHPVGTTARIATLEAALKPFAEYADREQSLPTDWPITVTRIGKSELTMGDCYAAANALTDPDR